MPQTTATHLGRKLYLATGWLCVCLGVIGAFLPLMPTTVFLLIAAWDFSRSSERWHRWLREHARFGETIRTFADRQLSPIEHSPELIRFYQRVRRALDRHRGDTPLDDDVTCLVVLVR